HSLIQTILNITPSSQHATRDFAPSQSRPHSSSTLAATPCYALYRSRFLCRFAFMRLRRLCFAIFAFRLFLREPIRFLNSRVRIQPSDALQCNSVLTLLGNITSLIFHLAST